MAIRTRKNTDKIPEPTLRRLPWYLSNAKLMKEKGEKYVSSTQISKQINIDASQIAKDLSYVDIAGRTRVGYDIDLLIQVLEDFWDLPICTGRIFSGLVAWGGVTARLRSFAFRTSDCRGFRYQSGAGRYKDKRNSYLSFR